MIAFAGILAGGCDNKLISTSFDPSNDSNGDGDNASLFVLDKYFNASITFRALKLSKPEVGSSQKMIGGFVNN